MTLVEHQPIGASDFAGFESVEPTPAAHGIREVQVWFGPADRPVFGWLTVPAGAVAHTGVVLCCPMAEEGRSAHRTFRRLSKELALLGLLALRFDYDGTGDSAGSLAEPGRVDAWLSSVGFAVDLLKSCGVKTVDAVGMRLGATIAATVASAGLARPSTEGADVPASPFQSLVLWDPSASGAGYLREGRALHSTGENSNEIIPDGVVDTPGFRFNADTVEQMTSLDLAALPAAPLASRTLVLVRGDRRLKSKVRQRLSAEPAVEFDVAVGQELMIDVSPSSATVPLQSIHRIGDWLAAADDLSSATPLSIPAGDQAAVISIPPRRTADSDVDGGVLRIDPGTVVKVLERAQSFGPHSLRGVVTEPLSGQTNLPWVVMLNVAVEHYIGPGRLWVDLAREWAGQGFRCVRLDQSGVGDSPTGPGQPEDVIFAREWISEVPEVIDELRAQGAPIVLMGLCSGAYSAFEAALHTEVDSIMVVNPRLRILETSKGQPLYDPSRRAARPPSKRLTRLARASHRKTYVAGGIWRVYRQFAFWHAPMAVLFSIARRGTDIRMISGLRDSRGFREVLLWSLARGLKLKWTTRLHFDTLAEIDHSLLAQSSQALTREIATEYLYGRYGVTDSVTS